MVSGKAELTIGEEVQKVSAPVKIQIPGNVRHKLVAITDIILLEDRENE